MDSLRLVRAVALERRSLPPLTGQAQIEFVQAAHRCFHCSRKGWCDEVLRDRARGCLQYFCPNGGYIATLNLLDERKKL